MSSIGMERWLLPLVLAVMVPTVLANPPRQLQDPSTYPYDCCYDRECLVCPGFAESVNACGAKDSPDPAQEFLYAFDITSDTFVCEPTGREETCCDTISPDPCEPNPGEICLSLAQYCWEEHFAVPCENDPGFCCIGVLGDEKIDMNFEDACTSDDVFAMPQSCPMRDFSTGPGPDDDVGMSGDPHVKTWGQTWFDYHGECDLVLLHAPNFDGLGNNLDIHVRTTIRYDYSFIESAAIQIGGDILEVSSYGDYAVNGVDTALLGGHGLGVGGRLAKSYPIHHRQPETKKHIFTVELGSNETIAISTFKDLVAVSVGARQESAKYFGYSIGIMGSYNGTLLARDGRTVMEDMNNFGNEWQVTDEEPMLFRTARAPQYPIRCILPSPRTANQRRRLGEATLERSSAEEACAHSKGARFKNCVFDVMAIGDLDIANS